VTEGIRYFEAACIDDESAIAASLGAPLGAGEGEAKRRAVGTRPKDLRSPRPTRERRFADFTVDRAVIAELGPGLGGFVQAIECEIGNALEHRQELPFDRVPQRLDFRILERRKSQCRVVQDAETGERLGDFLGAHRRAVIG